MDGYRLFFLLIFNIALSKGDNGCRDLNFLVCKSNMTLKNHVIKSFRMVAPGKEDCQHQCFMEKQCISYNLGKVFGKIRSCELSDADHVSDPGDLVPSEGSEYCPIENACASSPCPLDKVCQPDFAWNTSLCKDGRWSNWGAWSECLCFNRTRSRECKNPFTNETASDCSVMNTSIITQHGKCQHQKLCYVPLGMEDGRIKDEQITASSYLQTKGGDCDPKNARMNQCCGYAWCAAIEAIDQYLQVDLGSVMTVARYALQGRAVDIPHFAIHYQISYSVDGVAWNVYRNAIFAVPNVAEEFLINGATTYIFNLIPSIQARYIRITVKKFQTWPSLRIELYTTI